MRARTWGVVLSSACTLLGVVVMVVAGYSGPSEREVNQGRWLPSEPEKVRHYGNGWMAFELEVYGQRRRFLYHRHLGNDGGAETLVELLPQRVGQVTPAWTP